MTGVGVQVGARIGSGPRYPSGATKRKEVSHDVFQRCHKHNKYPPQLRLSSVASLQAVTCILMVQTVSKGVLQTADESDKFAMKGIGSCRVLLQYSF